MQLDNLRSTFSEAYWNTGLGFGSTTEQEPFINKYVFSHVLFVASAFTSFCCCYFIFLLWYSPHYQHRSWWVARPGCRRWVRSHQGIYASNQGNRSRPKDWLRGRGRAPPPSGWTNHLASPWSEMIRREIEQLLQTCTTGKLQWNICSNHLFLTGFVLKYFQSSEVCVLPPCCSPGRGSLWQGGGGAWVQEVPWYDWTSSPGSRRWDSQSEEGHWGVEHSSVRKLRTHRLESDHVFLVWKLSWHDTFLKSDFLTDSIALNLAP